MYICIYVYTTDQRANLGIKVFTSQANRLVLVFAFVGGMFSFTWP